MLSLIKFSFNVGCTDTPSWTNGYGRDCKYYGEHWCENGAVKPGQDYAFEAIYNNPENNCCVCGKGDSSNNLRDINYIILRSING